MQGMTPAILPRCRSGGSRGAFVGCGSLPISVTHPGNPEAGGISGCPDVQREPDRDVCPDIHRPDHRDVQTFQGKRSRPFNHPGNARCPNSSTPQQASPVSPGTEPETEKPWDLCPDHSPGEMEPEGYPMGSGDTGASKPSAEKGSHRHRTEPHGKPSVFGGHIYYVLLWTRVTRAFPMMGFPVRKAGSISIVPSQC